MGYYNDRMFAKKLIQQIVCNREVTEIQLQHIIIDKYGFGKKFVRDVLCMLEDGDFITIVPNNNTENWLIKPKIHKEQKTAESSAESIDGIRNT